MSCDNDPNIHGNRHPGRFLIRGAAIALLWVTFLVTGCGREAKRPPPAQYADVRGVLFEERQLVPEGGRTVLRGVVTDAADTPPFRARRVTICVPDSFDNLPVWHRYRFNVPRTTRFSVLPASYEACVVLTDGVLEFRSIRPLDESLPWPENQAGVDIGDILQGGTDMRRPPVSTARVVDKPLRGASRWMVLSRFDTGSAQGFLDTFREDQLGTPPNDRRWRESLLYITRSDANLDFHSVVRVYSDGLTRASIRGKEAGRFVDLEPDGSLPSGNARVAFKRIRNVLLLLRVEFAEEPAPRGRPSVSTPGEDCTHSAGRKLDSPVRHSMTLEPETGFKGRVWCTECTIGLRSADCSTESTSARRGSPGS